MGRMGGLGCQLFGLRRVRLLVGLLGVLSILCFGETVTSDVQFQNHAVVNEAVDGGRGRHRVLEYLLPLRERKIARQEHATAFVTLGQQRKQDFHLFATLLHVADVVDNQGVAFRETPNRSREFQVAFCDQ